MLTEKQAHKVARNLLKDFALECIEEQARRQKLSPSIKDKAEAKAFREIRKQTENFSTHWAASPPAGLAKVKDLEAYVKRKLVAAGDFKDLRKKVASQSLVGSDRIGPGKICCYSQRH